MTPEQQEQYAFWRKGIGRLEIDQTVRLDGNAVSRISRNRYVARVNGEIIEIGGRRMYVETCVALALSAIRERLIDGQSETLRCIRCKIAPREEKCYCKRCWSNLTIGYYDKKREKRTA